MLKKIKMFQLITIMFLFVYVYNVYGNYENEIHYENRIGLIVEGPEVPAERISGRLTDTAYSGDARFIHRENHTIRLIEETSGVLFSPTKPILYEIKIVQPGVHIVDARMRSRIYGGDMTLSNSHMETETRPFDSGWQSPERNHIFEEELTRFDGGSLQFTLKPFLHGNEERHYSLDIGLLLSIEAGFEHNQGGIVEAEIFREGDNIGTVHIANIIDLITVMQNDVIVFNYIPPDINSLTHVDNITIIENSPGNLQYNFELRFRVEASENGKRINYPFEMFRLFIEEIVTNEAESGFKMEHVYNTETEIVYRVINPSYGIPAEITLNEVHLGGRVRAFDDWHIVVYGPEISPNSYKFLLDTEYSNINDIYKERARIFDLGYNAHVIQVGNSADRASYFIYALQSSHNPNLQQRRTFNVTSLVEIDGVNIQAVAFPNVTFDIVSSMISPRVFAYFIGTEVTWNEAARTIVFTGDDMQGSPKTVTLTLNSPTIIVNGQTYDIAVKAGQHELEGQICPIVINNRTFVPVRVLAEIFDVPIDFATGSIILG